MLNGVCLLDHNDRGQLMQMGWAMHSIRLPELYEAVRTGTLRQLTMAQRRGTRGEGERTVPNRPGGCLAIDPLYGRNVFVSCGQVMGWQSCVRPVRLFPELKSHLFGSWIIQ